MTGPWPPPGTVLLDATRPDRDAGPRRSFLFARPERVLTARAPSGVPALLEQIDDAVAAGRYVAGYLGYEAGYAFERIGPAEENGAQPLAWFGVYADRQVLGAEAVEALLRDAAGAQGYAVCHPRFAIGRDAYRQKIAAVKAHIRAGDVYQINLTDRVVFGFEGSAVALYRALRRRQRVAYGALLNTGAARVLSLSPELFFRREGEKLVTRPMKGTVRRGRTLAEDEALSAWLAADEKSRAENLMIVDLLRNDLSVCCRPGSVRVPRLFETEPYETVTQMTSTVEGTLQDGAGYAEIFRALFPCGSVTGAPKIRAMQVIRDLEEKPRGMYCGAIGYAGPGHAGGAEAAFNVAIRTVVLGEGKGTMGTGGGIVWDSEAEAEYAECLLKARFLSEEKSAQAAPGEGPPALIETMLWAEGEVALLDRHARRMARSAAYFGYPFDSDALRRRVEEKTEALDPETRHKVRATLDAAGRLAVEATPLPPKAASEGLPLRVHFARQRVDAEDPLFFHKTTARAVYEAAFQEAQAAGYDEALLLNKRGEVTEGTCTNVFVKKDGIFYTPPAESGLLAGVYRAHLLETLPAVRERVLRPRDLVEADAIYLCNAVHSARAAVLEPAAVPAA